jgi:hypothetical protein
VGAALGAEIGTAVVPLVGTAIGVIAGWVVGGIGGILFANCDGVVAAGVHVYSSTDLIQKTAAGHKITETVEQDVLQTALEGLIGCDRCDGTARHCSREDTSNRR